MKDMTIPYRQLTLGREVDFTNPRSRINKTALKNLAASIEAQGLLQPLVVQVMKDEGGNEHHVVIAGGRRYRAIGMLIKAKKDGGLKDSVPCRVVDGSDMLQAKVSSITENLEREELSSYELAVAMQDLKDNGMSQKEISEQLKRSQTWVSRQLKSLNNVIPAVKRAWKAEKLPVETVQELSVLDGAEQEDRFKVIMEHREAAENGTANSMEARGKARKAAKGSKGKGKKKGDDDVRMQRPSADVLQEFLRVASGAATESRYLDGVCHALRFALGEIGPGEFDEEFSDAALSAGESEEPPKASRSTTGRRPATKRKRAGGGATKARKSRGRRKSKASAAAQ